MFLLNEESSKESDVAFELAWVWLWGLLGMEFTTLLILWEKR